MEFGKEDLEKARSIISTTITNCEKAQIKFSEGTAQHSLLKNRIKALSISKSLLLGDSEKPIHAETCKRHCRV
jgi:hypothetical protein